MHRYNQQPIEIGRLQRFAMDDFYARGPRLNTPPVTKEKRIACVGGGPASLACAAELRLRGYSVTIYESQEMAGGLNTYGVAEYKFTPVDSQREVEFIRSLGIDFQFGVTVGDDLMFSELESQYAAIFIGVGLGATKKLGIPGEDLKNIVDAIQYIAEYKTASPRVADQVVVIGGGNTAIDAAMAANKLGARDVRMLYRRGPEHLSAFDFEVEHARQEGIEFFFHTTPAKFIGSNGSIEAVECSTPSGPVRFECQLAVLAIGQIRPLELLARAARPPYFAGGDALNGGREVVDAVAEGKRGAINIAAYLENTHG
jgi:glutamate synthase (NADPH/NADH) small chain